MKTIGKVFEPVVKVDNVEKLWKEEFPEEQPLLYIPADKTYFTILGHRIDQSFDSFESFAAYLQHIKDVEEKNGKMSRELKILKNYIHQIRYYLEMKMEEAALERTYENGMIFLSMREQMYKTILEDIDKIVEGKYILDE